MGNSFMKSPVGTCVEARNNQVEIWGGLGCYIRTVTRQEFFTLLIYVGQ